MDAIYWVLKQFQKYSLFVNLKKCCFYQNKVYFLRLVVSSQEINIKEKKIEVVKAWPKPKSLKDIQVFLRFANFYQHFISSFSKTVILLTLILKTIFFFASINIYIKAISNSNFLTLKTKLAFLQIKQTFTKVSILHYFDPEYYIWIETNASNYFIGSILCQLILEFSQ